MADDQPLSIDQEEFSRLQVGTVLYLELNEIASVQVTTVEN